MGHLQATLFGKLRFSYRYQDVELNSRKATALLAYLCLENRACSRDKLAELFWGVGKLANLRQALYEIRKLPGSQDWLYDDNDNVHVLAKTDVAAFEAALSQKASQDALRLYQGNLLADLPLKEVTAFNDWLELERTRLQALYLEALQQEVAVLEQADDFAAALELVQLLLHLDTLNETAYQSAMRLLHLQGKSQAALQLYRNCQQVLQHELGAEPLESTRKLARQIERGERLERPVYTNLLSPSLQQLLGALALGLSQNSELLAQVLEREALVVASELTELQTRGFLDDHLQLKADLQKSVLQSMPASLKQLLSQRAAQWYQTFQPEEKVLTAKFWLRAHQPLLAAPLLLQAAKAAFASAAPETQSLCFYVLWCAQGTVRFEALMLLEALAERQADKPLQEACLNELTDLAWRLQEDKKLADVRLRQARFDMRQGQQTEALKQVEEALEIAQRLQDQELLYQVYMTLGGVHYFAGQLEQAYQAFSQVTNTQDLSLRFRALNNLGAIAGIRKELSQSYSQFAEALTLARQLGNLDAVSATLNNLANTAERLAEYDKAEKHYRETLSLVKRTKDQRIEITTLLNLAFIHTRRGRLGLAWNTAQEALELAMSAQSLRDQGIAHEQLAEVARFCTDYDLALEKAQLALAIFEQLKDERRSLSSKANVAILSCAQEPTKLGAALAALATLREKSHHDMSSWAYLELALMTHDLAAIEFCLEQVVPEGNPHLDFVWHLVRVRGAYLAGLVPDTAQLEEQVLSLEVTERPLAYLYLGKILAQSHYLTLAAKDLQTQAEGLPRKLRDRLLSQLELWA